MSALEFGGAFLMGVMGSLHCVAMCGPIAAVLCGSNGRAGCASTSLLPHTGRLLTYTAIGALAGALGGALQRLIPLEVVQLGARLAAATLLIAVGFYAAGFLRRFGRIERLTAPLFARLARRLPRGVSGSPGFRVLHGAIWGLVPCGLVYGAAGLAVIAGSPARGALVMAAFGAGTLPAMVLVGVFADGFRRAVRDPRIRQGAGLLLAVAGSVHLALAFRWANVVFAAPVGVSAPATQASPSSEAPAESPARPSCH